MAKQTTKPETVKTENEVKAEVKSEGVETPKSEEVKSEGVETPKSEEVKSEGVETPQTIIAKTFDKATEETNKKLDEKPEVNETKDDLSEEEEIIIEEDEDFVDENLEGYSTINLDEGDAKLAVESIVIEEELDLSKDSVQLALKENEDTIYYRIKKDSDEWSEWKIYAKIEIEKPESLEGIDADIEKILCEEHYFNFSTVGRFIINGKYTEEDLEKFYNEFKTAEILFNKNHYDLLDLLNKKFK